MRMSTGLNECTMTFEEVIEATWKAIVSKYETLPKGTKPSELHVPISRYKNQGKLPRPDFIIKHGRTLGLNLTLTVTI